MKELPLTLGLVALVDDEDFLWLRKWKWGAWLARDGKTYYAFRKRNKEERRFGHSRRILMHRIIMGAWPDEQVDHIHHNGLDNRKSELRVCTLQQNNWNQAVRIRQLPKGVIRSISGHRYMAQIREHGNHHYLGTFDTVEQAARTYDAAAVRFFGEFASLNYPLKDQEATA